MFNFHPIVSFDGATSYMRFFEHPAFRTVATPGYPIFVEILKQIGANSVWAGQIVSALAVSLLVFPLFGLLKRYMSEQWALWGCAVVSANPLIFRYGMITMSDATGLFFFVLTLWLFTEKRFWWCGVGMFMAYLTRPELIVVLPFLIRRKSWPVFLAFGLGMLVYVGWLSWDRGVFTLTSKGTDVIQPTLDGYFGRFKAHGWNLVQYAGMASFVWVFNRKKLPIVLSGLAIMLILPLYPALLIHGRYVIVPVFAVLFVAWVFIASNYYKIILASLLIISYIPTVGEITKPDEDMAWMKDVGERLNTPKFTRFMDRKPYIAFYADGIYDQMPRAEIDSVLKYAVERGDDAIVLTLTTIYGFYPWMVKLAEYETLYVKKTTYAPILREERAIVWLKK